MARARTSVPACVAVVVLAAAVALAACGASPARHAGAPSPPAMRLSAADMGKTVTVQRGATVVVSLPTVQGFEPWSTPAVDAPSVLAPVGRGSPAPGQSPGGTTTATFRAAGDGTTRITSHAKVACPEGRGVACPMVVRAWSVTVRVTG